MKNFFVHSKIIFLLRIFFSFFKLYIFFSNHTVINKCSNDLFLKLGKCENGKNKCNYEECKISNIIKVGEKDYRYLSFASKENEDLIFSTTSCPKHEKRIFWGIKKNGRQFFNSDYFNHIYSSSSNIENYEFQSIIIKLSGDQNKGKEYLLNVGKGNSNVEIYDFENSKIYDKSNDDFSECSSIQSFRNSACFAFEENNSFYYLFYPYN